MMALVYYEPHNFLPQELVSPEAYADLGDQSFLVMDYRILKTVDAIRDFFGKPVYINNWHWKGDKRYRGFRPWSCKQGSAWSQHKFGRAADMTIKDISAEDARKAILAASRHFPYITCMEDGVPWLHVDCRAIAGQKIVLFKP